MRAVFILCFIGCFSFAASLQASAIQHNTPKVKITKKKAVLLAKKSTDGKTLKITDNKQFYTVRILKTDGHVVDLNINKKTGEVKKDQ
jgi:uncharacterized membrane protein YkoI